MNAPHLQSFDAWFSIWTQPRATIQTLIDTNPGHSVIVLSILAGIYQIFDSASGNNLGDEQDLMMIIGMALVLGAVVGLIGLYLSAFLIEWTGRWIGGQGNQPHLRTAIAWSGIPKVFGLTIWLPALYVFGQELFASETPNISSNPMLATLLLAFITIQVICAIWSFVLLLKCVGQVQGFSAWKALGNVILSSLVIIVPLFVISFAFISFTHGS